MKGGRKSCLNTPEPPGHVFSRRVLPRQSRRRILSRAVHDTGVRAINNCLTPPPMAGKGTLSTQVPAGPRALSPRLPTRRLSHSSDRQGAPQARQRGLLHDGRRVGMRPPGGRWRAQPRSLESVFPETRSNARLGCAPLAWPPAPLTWDCRVALSPLWHKTGR